MSKHPIQPIIDNDGAFRFKGNKIVRHLLDNGPFDMNDLAVQDFSDEDREQFAQLIGYSLNGFSELSYASNDTYHAACKMSEGKDEKDARIESLEATLDAVRKGMKTIVPELFRIHPDDLTT